MSKWQRLFRTCRSAVKPPILFVLPQLQQAAPVLAYAPPTLQEKPIRLRYPKFWKQTVAMADQVDWPPLSPPMTPHAFP